MQIRGTGLAATGAQVEPMVELGAGGLGIALMLAAGHRRRKQF